MIAEGCPTGGSMLSPIVGGGTAWRVGDTLIMAGAIVEVIAIRNNGNITIVVDEARNVPHTHNNASDVFYDEPGTISAKAWDRLSLPRSLDAHKRAWPFKVVIVSLESLYRNKVYDLKGHRPEQLVPRRYGFSKSGHLPAKIRRIRKDN